MSENNLSLNTELRQQLKLTPEMKLGLDILQATHLELRDILNKEMNENTLVDDISIPEATAEEEIKPDEKEKSEENDLSAEETIYDRQEHFEHEYNPDDEKLADYRYNSIRQEEEIDLQGYLAEQLNELKLSNEMHTAVYVLILSLDEKGMLDRTPEEIAASSNQPVENLKKAMDVLHTFEPAGVGASSARESLLIQMRRKHMKETLAYSIIEKYFDEMEKQQNAKIAKALKVSESDVAAAVKTIGELDPFPGKNYGIKENPEYITPDVMIEEEDGRYYVALPDESIDIRLVNPEIMKKYKENKETREFLKKHRYEERIKALMASLVDRNKTIKKVVERIIEIQQEYLNDQKKGLQPLTLREIASAVGVHESTVSRIVSRKYVQTPGGVYPLKDFFSSKLQSSGGGNISSSAAREKMKVMINTEDKASPLTDTEIAEKLNAEGIKIKRRTVTKYREQMEIPPVNLRKK